MARMKSLLSARLFALAAILIIVIGYLVPSFGQQVDPRSLNQLRFRFIGPQGNRISAVVGAPGNNNVYYVGAASGGVWKSEDGGINWRPVFDDQPAMSIGSLAIAPSDANIVWAGTGESFIRSNVSIGNGIYKSTDAGKTWTHMGLEKTGRIGRIVIDPRDPNIVFAAALGTCYGPQQERGVYRTTDGGKNWERVLFADENTGASEIAMDPNNPRVLFAGMWTIDIKTWGKFSGGPGSGLYVSRDGGTTWRKLVGRGLPTFQVGKVAVAVAQRNSNRVYALFETGGKGSLWRSDDGGESWRVVNYSRLLNERPDYYTRMMISPDNYNEVYFPSNFMYVTYDGGESTESIWGGGDDHDMWADPTNADRMMIGHDQGVMITTNHGKGWNRAVLPVGQMYHVATDNRVPYYVYANMQDYASLRGPSNYMGGGISSGTWSTTAGCESGFSFPDPVDNNIIWGGCYEGGTERYDLRTGQARSVNPWPESFLDAPADKIKYRWNWTHPISISPHDHNVVYAGSQVVHMTRDGGQSWKVISPDLTLNDHSKMGSSGGLTPDNLGVEYGGTLFAIAESPVEKGLIWTGSNDGQVNITRDAGAHWTNVTAAIPDLPAWGTISNIEPSKYDAGAAYISVDLHQVNNRDPFIYKTTDYGKSWKLISSDIPKSVFSYVHCVREDPVRKGLLFAGTENGLYVSFNDGEKWVPLQSGLPHAPVSWMTVQEDYHDLVVATSGRGIYILDDITPLEQMQADTVDSAFYAFDLRPVYRLRKINRVKGVPNDQSAGRDAPYGASINYYIKGGQGAAPAPDNADTGAAGGGRRGGGGGGRAAGNQAGGQGGGVEITVLDDKGTIVRKLSGPRAPGMNRTWWDLRYERTKEPELRTTPASNPHVWEEKRFKGRDTRGIYHYGIEEPKIGPLAAPGTYTIKISFNGQETSKKLVVKKDPNSAGTEADIQAATKMGVELRDNINTVVDMVNHIEVVRKQIEDLPKYLKGEDDSKPVLTAAKELDDKILAVEDQLIQRALQTADVKSYEEESTLYIKLLFLAGQEGDGAGDIAGNPDFKPTDQEVEVHQILKQRLAAVEVQYNELMKKTIPAFNAMLNGKGVQPLVGMQ